MSMGNPNPNRSPAARIHAVFVGAIAALAVQNHKGQAKPREEWRTPSNWMRLAKAGFYRVIHRWSKGRRKPHQGPKECARRMEQMSRGHDLGQKG